jgi:hypothetical protein
MVRSWKITFYYYKSFLEIFNTFRPVVKTSEVTLFGETLQLKISDVAVNLQFILVVYALITVKEDSSGNM